MTRDSNSRERATDRHGWARYRALVVRENWYRDVWLLIVTGLVLLAISGQGRTLAKVREGRHVAVALNCGTSNAIIGAGRSVIEQSASPPPPSERVFFANLARLGYPPLAVRRAQARQASHAYAEAISRAVAAQVGVATTRRVVRPDGTIDCAAAARLAKTS